MYISQIIEQLTENGVYEIEPGVHLFTQECIINEQEDWDDEDPCKNFDFTTANFWLIYKEMKEPEPFNTIKEFFTEHVTKY